MKKQKDDFLKKVIICMAIFLVIFTVSIIVIFCVTGGQEPSTLVAAVFAACMGEYSICGMIKNRKEKEETIRIQQSLSEQETEDEIEEELYDAEEIDE